MKNILPFIILYSIYANEASQVSSANIEPFHCSLGFYEEDINDIVSRIRDKEIPTDVDALLKEARQRGQETPVSRFCSGTLISQNQILTANHCLDIIDWIKEEADKRSAPMPPFHAQCGVAIKRTLNMDSWTPHDSLDMAMVELDSPIVLPTAAIASQKMIAYFKSVNDTFEGGTGKCKVVATGTNYAVFDEGIFRDVLNQSGRLYFQDNEITFSLFRNDPLSVFLGPGDSGAGLFCRYTDDHWYLTGVLKRGTRFANGKGLIRYVNINGYQEWIEINKSSLNIETLDDTLDYFQYHCELGQRCARILNANDIKLIGDTTEIFKTMADTSDDVTREQLDSMTTLYKEFIDLCYNSIINFLNAL